MGFAQEGGRSPAPLPLSCAHLDCRRLVDAKQPQKVVVFYRYLFDERFLKEAVRDDWLKLYDKEVGGWAQVWVLGWLSM